LSSRSRSGAASTASGTGVTIGEPTGAGDRLVSIAFGVVLFARPRVGAVALALLFGLFSLIYGVSQIAMGIQLCQTGRTLHPVVEKDAA
jgi:uncharacterized membrane protein HdeD (DUF308 family)